LPTVASRFLASSTITVLRIRGTPHASSRHPRERLALLACDRASRSPQEVGAAGVAHDLEATSLESSVS
jgi:hypothetical protein